MAVQLLLDAGHDIVVDANGDLLLVDEGAQVAQHVKQRLRFYQEEWFLDQRLGVPWFQEILGSRRFNNTATQRVYSESFIKQEILETPEVTRLINFNFAFDEVNRLANFNFRFDTIYGEVGDELFDVSLNNGVISG